MINWDKNFLRSAFSESDGTGSSSRLLSAIIIVASLSWITIVVVHTKALPDLASISVFVSSTVGVLYGINKISTKASDAVLTKNINTKGEN